jgi:MFS family permease
VAEVTLSAERTWAGAGYVGDVSAVVGAGQPSAAGSWRRVAFAMFAVGWGANQFSPLLVGYRHELQLSAGVLAGLFAIYAAALIPGLLVGGPVSDRIGRRPSVIPFVVASPVATVLLMLGPHSLALIAAGRALAGLCSGVVFGSATAWVQELSGDPAVSARRSAVALSAGFALGPAVAAALAQGAPDPLVLPYLPHVLVGLAAVAVIWPAPETLTREPRVVAASGSRRPGWPPRAVRSRRFWLAVAPAAPWVFGSASLAFVVLPQEVTSAGSLSVGFAGLVTALTVTSGIAIQPVARRIEARRRLAGNVAGLGCAALGAAGATVAVTSASRAGAIGCAVAFGLAYGLCLVSGLRECERLADRREHGAVVACYYALTYVGFGAPYLMAALNGALGRAAAFAVLAAAAALTAIWTAAFTRGSRPAGVKTAGAAAPQDVRCGRPGSSAEGVRDSG